MMMAPEVAIRAYAGLCPEQVRDAKALRELCTKRRILLNFFDGRKETVMYKLFDSIVEAKSRVVE